MKFLTHTRKILYALIIFSVLIKCLSIFNTVLNSDGALYSQVAFNIAHNKWYELKDFFGISGNFLDKPHFAFWIINLAFKAFGTSILVYNSCAVVAILLGGWLVYKLARLFFIKDTSLIAAIIYLNILDINNSLISPKLEPYLILFITGSTYFALKYALNSKIKYLLLTCIFAACSAMTKGYFTIVMPFSPLIALYIYFKLNPSEDQKHLWPGIVKKPLISLIMAMLLILLFISPCVIAYYLQFGKSGVEFFFWKSQFARFLGVPGAEVEHNTTLQYYIKHIPSMCLSILVGMLPFTFLLTVIKKVKRHCHITKYKSPIFEICILSPVVTIIMVFAVSHYYNFYYNSIISPFISIYFAWIFTKSQKYKLLHNSLLVIAFLVITLVIATNLLLFNSIVFTAGIIAFIICVVTYYKFTNIILRSLIILVVTVNCHFIYNLAIFHNFYTRHNLGYTVGKILKSYPPHPLVMSTFQDVSSVSVVNPQIYDIQYNHDLSSLPYKDNNPFYLVINSSNYGALKEQLQKNKLTYKIIATLDDRDNPTVEDILVENLHKFSPFNMYLGIVQN
ncbi:MAG: Undecaprenyl phosphate-alpha-4-amino-4-deoxy-L-arabinose arabinosyl transferase [Burkholderiales bacterium]|jgi:4-amino-4-deoxy-L-arabinose transferase-like glycosyltransferase|nr:Undecaprenyl phosphate-alpha-4-amino-4-deoxy-L-arabinose arabinosyl transferase [Burkholderiales bacterium]